MNTEEKIDLLRRQIEELTKQFKTLVDVYKSTIMEEQKNMKSYMEQAIEAVRKEVTETIRRMKTQPDVYHEVEVPASIKQRIVRKSLDSPNCLIHAILHREATPSEIIYALATIREKQRLRGRLHD
jgi:DNA repair exonuclease SbcCD ATPase subunit